MTGNIQFLELADDLFPKILNGEKTNTLRWNEGNIKEGYLTFYKTSNPSVKCNVLVSSIETAPMKDFAHKYNMSSQDLHFEMLRHYPDIKIDSEVSFIEFTLHETA